MKIIFKNNLIEFDEIIISGVTNTEITKLSSLHYTKVQTDTLLNEKVNTSDFDTFSNTTNSTLNSLQNQVTANDNDIVFLSGQSDLRLVISDFNTYSGNTKITIDNNTSNINANDQDILFLSAITTGKTDNSVFNAFSANTDNRINSNDADLLFLSGQSNFTANNGIEKIGNNLRLGGSLTGNTIIDSNGFGLTIGTGTTAQGAHSFAVNQNNTASGINSFAEGLSTSAIGNNSHAEGNQTIASGSSSHAQGHNTCAIGNYSHAEGCNTRASGSNSHSQGRNTIAIGNYSHAQGNNTRACGNSSHAEGNNTCSIGNYSHSEGRNTRACGSNSHSEGYCTVAGGSNSHSEGYYTYACGSGSHAEGNCTRANGFASHAEGYYTYSNEKYTHSEGYCTHANGIAAHSEGRNTCAIGNYSHSGGFGHNLRYIIASGISSFNHSVNNIAQIVGHGANANYSAILGGVNHNIESGNTGATVIGGVGIKLTGTSYVNTTAVQQLAIISGLTAGSTNDTILVRDSSTGIIKGVNQSTLDQSADILFLSAETSTNSTNISTNLNHINFISGVTDQNRNFVTGYTAATSLDLNFISGITDQNSSNITSNDNDISFLSGQTQNKYDKVSAVNNRIAIFNNSGDTIQDSGFLISDITGTSATGETNTITNIGIGEGVFKEKIGVDFKLRSLSGGSGISINTGDTLVINAEVTTADLNTKLNISNFNLYSGNTQNSINFLSGKTNKNIADIGHFQNFSGLTNSNLSNLQNQIDSNDLDIIFLSSSTANKIDKVTGATDNLGTFLSGGSLQNSGIPVSDLTGKTSLLTFNQFTGDTSANLSFISGITDQNSSNITTNLNQITANGNDIVFLSGQSDLRLVISDFNTYSGTTQTDINKRLLTSDFNIYSGATQTDINNRLLTTDFNIYSGNTDTEIKSKAPKLSEFVDVNSSIVISGNTDNYKIFEIAATGGTGITITITTGVTSGYQFTINNLMTGNTATITGGTNMVVDLPGTTLAAQGGGSFYVRNNNLRGFGNLS